MEFLYQLSDNSLFSWVILPALIFLARVCDVTLGTVRIIFIARSRKFLAPLLGFFEVSIWLLAISQIMQNVNNFVCFFAYAFGFATGNFVGILIEEKLAMGTLIVRIILAEKDTSLKERLFDAGFGVTVIDGQGKNGAVEMLFSVIKRRDLDKIVNIIEECKSNAFYSVEDAKSVSKGIFPTPRPGSKRFLRKGK